MILINSINGYGGKLARYFRCCQRHPFTWSIAVIIFIYSCTSGDNSEVKYHITKPELIHTVTLEYPSGETVKLKRENSTWILNDRYLARMDAVDLLLKTMSQVRLKFIPARAALEMINNDIEDFGVKVTVADRNKRILASYRVGGVTNDELGTYLHLEGEDHPVVVHIPHWEGSLRPRFVMSIEDWRDRTILDVNSQNVLKLSVEYPKQKSSSFIIRNNQPPTVEPFYNFTETLSPQNPGIIKVFLDNLGTISGEAFINSHPDKETLKLQIPFAEIRVDYVGNKSKVVKVYPIPIELSSGQIERYWVYTSDDDFILAQRRILRKILRPYDYFFP